MSICHECILITAKALPEQPALFTFPGARSRKYENVRFCKGIISSGNDAFDLSKIIIPPWLRAACGLCLLTIVFQDLIWKQEGSSMTSYNCSTCIQIYSVFCVVTCNWDKNTQPHSLEKKGRLNNDIYFANEFMESLDVFSVSIVHLQMEILIIQRRSSRSPENTEIGLVALLFCKDWRLRNEPSYLTPVHGYCSVHLTFLGIHNVLVAVVVPVYV